MKQLVMLSGKGGTGKTSLAAAFAHLASQSHFADRIVLADADVDAANLELVLQPRLLEQEDFLGGQVAVIDQNTCASCGDCLVVCRFDAINPHPRPLSQGERGEYWVDPIACDGCAACVYQCPTGSISMHEQVAGTFCVSESRYGPLYHASLYPGAENSGKLVTLAVSAHELPQEVGDFAILLESGYSRRRALAYNAMSSLSTLPGAILAYYFLMDAQRFTANIMALLAVSFIYIAIADLIPSLHRQSNLQYTFSQFIFILAGVGTIVLFHLDN